MIKEKFFIVQNELDFLANTLFADEFPNLIDTIDKPKYSISDLHVSPRDATYWDKQGILPILKGTSMRRKYDLPQSIWIKLIQQMRSLGVNLATIKNLKDNLLEPKLDFINYDKDKLNQIISELIAKGNFKISPEQLLSEFAENGPSIFKSIVLATIVFRKNFQCIVNKEGDYILYDSSRHQELLLTEAEFAEFVSEPYFSLSFAKAYQSLVKERSLEPFISVVSLLSKSEIEILELIRKRNINSIKIQYKNGEPDLIEVNEKNELTPEQRFLDVISKNGFHKISLTTRNGKIVYYENIIQKKLNKVTK
jgi:DNA-binding transcriptional MerR regulator